MSDDLSKTGKQDDIRININQDHEVAYWTDRLNVTADRLTLAVKEVGPMVKDVKAYLAGNSC
jgi:hypothetical protein